MPGCAAVDCSNRAEQGFSMKIFPRDPTRRAVWAAKVKRKDWTPSNSSYLCEAHFDDDQWIFVSGKKKLKPDAVPTIFAHSPLLNKRKCCSKSADPPLKKIALSHDEHTITAVPPQENNDVNQLKQELLAAKETIAKLWQENINLKRKIHSQATQLSRYKRQQMSQASCCHEKIFNKNQVDVISSESKYKRWSDDTVKTALGLRFSCGTAGYENLLALNLPYPSVRTLQRRLQNIKFESGLLHEVFEFLKFKVQNFSPEQRWCALYLDEMAIREAVEYDQNSKTYFGRATFPGQSGNANHALVFMLGGITSRWKQVVAYHFTNGQSDGAVLKEIIVEIMKKTEELGLRLHSITSDMGSFNQAMWKSFGVLSGRYSKTKSSVITCH